MLVLDLEAFFLKIGNILRPHINSIEKYGLYYRYKRYPLKYVGVLRYENTQEFVDLSRPLEYDKSYGNIIDDKYTLIADSASLSNGMIDTVPFLEILPAEILINIIDTVQLSNNPHKDLFFNDPLGYTSDINLLSIHKFIVYPEDVIDSIGNLPSDIRIKLNNLYMNMIQSTILPFMSMDVEAVYSCDIDSTIIRISRGKNIKSIRYDLALEMKGI